MFLYMKKRDLIILWIILILVIGGLVYYFFDWNFTGKVLDVGDTSIISRSFVGNEVNKDISVTVEVLIDERFNHHAYIIEEVVPSEFTIVDAGGATKSGNVLRWYEVDEINVIDSIDLTYVVSTSQSGTYFFNGTYGIDGMDSIEAIKETNLIIEDGGNQLCFEEYSCGEWSKCINNSMKRVCVDKNKCSIDKSEVQSCDNFNKNLNISSIKIKVISFCLVLFLIFYLWFLFFRKNKSQV